MPMDHSKCLTNLDNWTGSVDNRLSRTPYFIKLTEYFISNVNRKYKSAIILKKKQIKQNLFISLLREYECGHQFII